MQADEDDKVEPFPSTTSRRYVLITNSSEPPRDAAVSCGLEV